MYRTPVEFLALHSSLSLKHLIVRRKGLQGEKLPRFPLNLIPAAQHGDTAELEKCARKYLQILLFATRLSPLASDVCSFLAVSSLSFCRCFVQKPMEIPITLQKSFFSSLVAKLKPGRLRRRHKKGPKANLDMIEHSFLGNRDLWMVMGESWIAFLRIPFDPVPIFVILLDNSFRVEYKEVFKNPIKLVQSHIPSPIAESVSEGKAENITTNRLLGAYFLLYTNSFDPIKLRPISNRDIKHFTNNIVSLDSACEYMRKAEYCSFAPPRYHSHVAFYIDGAGYFTAVADAIESAKENIYITGWWLFPHTYLRRPITEESRFDLLLTKAANRGVKVYILVYKEVPATLPLKSSYTKKVLLNLSKNGNIKILRHPDFVNLWAHHEKSIIIDEYNAFLGGLDICLGRYDTNMHPLFVSSSCLFGQDNSNPRIIDFHDIDTMWQMDSFDRSKCPRMPWHDVSVGVIGNPDVARHFVQRWNFTKMRREPKNDEFSILLPPSSNEQIISQHFKIELKMKTQILRSLSLWSSGIFTECSIQTAYCNLIRTSKSFVYIENQFFITSCGNNKDVFNLIGEAIVQRIISAHENGEEFKVIVVMPLLPAFPGEIDAAAGSSLRLIMDFQYKSILRSPDSIIANLSKKNIPSEKYIQFYGLRQFAYNFETPPKPCTEIVYVHSKLMIVDDEQAIIGSANLNDRSMKGSRDSELAVLIQGDPSIKKFRMKLMNEHSGLQEPNVHSEQFSLEWDKVAEWNTMIYRAMFSCVPDDSVETFEQYQTFTKKKKRPHMSHKLNMESLNMTQKPNMESLASIKGILVKFPLNFLRKENLEASFFAKENLVPPNVFS